MGGVWALGGRTDTNVALIPQDQVDVITITRTHPLFHPYPYFGELIRSFKRRLAI